MTSEEMSIFEWIDAILRNSEYESINVAEEIKSFLISKKNKEYKFALYRGIQKKAQYILVIDICKEPLDEAEIIKKQISMYKSLLMSNEKLEPDFDKNVSLLLCVNSDITDEKIEKTVLDIEENPYCFKKLVLTYTDCEIEMLEKVESDNIWDFILSKVEVIKNGEQIDYQNLWFRLIFKILMKLPFITVDIVKKEKKEKLLKQIEEKLDIHCKSIWDDLKEMEKDEVEAIKNYSEEQMEVLLSKWCTEEE